MKKRVLIALVVVVALAPIVSVVWAAEPVGVGIDVKPGSCPNCFNPNGHGVIPVAILGSDVFEVTDVDPETLVFGGLEVRRRGKNGTPQCSIEDVSGPTWAPDGFLDLVCQFVDDDTFDGTAELTGELFDRTPIVGSHTICTRPPD